MDQAKAWSCGRSVVQRDRVAARSFDGREQDPADPGRRVSVGDPANEGDACGTAVPMRADHPERWARRCGSEHCWPPFPSAKHGIPDVAGCGDCGWACDPGWQSRRSNGMRGDQGNGRTVEVCGPQHAPCAIAGACMACLGFPAVARDEALGPRRIRSIRTPRRKRTYGQAAESTRHSGSWPPSGPNRAAGGGRPTRTVPTSFTGRRLRGSRGV